jgi:acyl-CoA thioesterase
MSSEFSVVLESMRRDRDRLTVVVPDDWLQGRSVFGGMQMALAMRAMRETMPDEARVLPLRTAQVTFVAPLPGREAIAARAETLRVGRSTSHARCDLMHGTNVACSVTAVFGQPRPSQFVREIPRPDVPAAPEELADAFQDARVAPAFVQHLQMRWARGGPPGSGQSDPRTSIYVRLRDTRCEPEDALVALADSIPTPVLSMLRKPAPASSLTWMLEVVRDPVHLDVHGWAFIDTEVRAGTDGYLSQTSLLYGADGHAYAVSHQTVGVFA